MSSDQTEMGGTRASFPATNWSLIADIQGEDDRHKKLIGLLLESYWQPTYCYLCHKGYDREQAEDLTQDFLYDTVLVRNLVGRADIRKGRFRSFLLHTLRQYLVDRQRRALAQKRVPQAKLVSLETVDLSTLSQSLAQSTAEDAYHYAWIRTILQEVALKVRRLCHNQGMKIHWDLFHDYVLQPSLDGSASSLADICAKHGIEHTKKVSNMITTVKRRFRKILVQHVYCIVDTDEQAAEELAYFRRFLQRGRTHYRDCI